MSDTVQRNVEARRFELIRDGVVAGFIDYRERDDNQIWFTHTEVDAAFAGQGLATILTQGAIEDALADPDAVLVPACPYTRTWLKKHPEFEDRVDESPLPPESEHS